MSCCAARRIGSRTNDDEGKDEVGRDTRAGRRQLELRALLVVQETATGANTALCV